MSLSKEEQIEIILLAGSGSYCKVAEEVSKRYPLSTHIPHDTVTKLIEKF
jgi:glycerol-3-phosphate O-acyltransferase